MCHMDAHRNFDLEMACVYMSGTAARVRRYCTYDTEMVRNISASMACGLLGMPATNAEQRPSTE